MEIIWISEKNVKCLKFTEVDFWEWVSSRGIMKYRRGDPLEWAENLLRHLRNAPAELKPTISKAQSSTKESLKMKTEFRMERTKD